MPRKLFRQPQDELEVLRQEVWDLKEEVRKIRAANTTTVQTVHTDVYDVPTQGELALHWDDASAPKATKRVRVGHEGEWYDIGTQWQIPWVRRIAPYHQALIVPTGDSEILEYTEVEGSDGWEDFFSFSFNRVITANIKGFHLITVELIWDDEFDEESTIVLHNTIGFPTILGGSVVSGNLQLGGSTSGMWIDRMPAGTQYQADIYHKAPTDKVAIAWYMEVAILSPGYTGLDRVDSDHMDQ